LVESLDIELGGDEQQVIWTWRTVEASTFERVVLLTNEGMKVGEIASELEINRSTVSRHLKRARSEGLLTKPAGGKGGSHGSA
jgi:predicted transcriptional regulator